MKRETNRKQDSEWNSFFYETVNGKKPVEEYLGSLDLEQRAKVLSILLTVQSLGFHEALRKTKHISFLEDKIYEIRVEWKSNIFRVFTFTIVGNKFILTNGFTKKTQKTPRREIVKAKKYRDDFISRYEKGEITIT